MGDYLLKYRTFNSLMADVNADLETLYQDNDTRPHQLVKVASRVNYELGLRIQQTKETILEVEKGRVKLPNDFNVFNYGFICGKHTVKVTPTQGTIIEERRVDGVPEYNPFPEPKDQCDPCSDGAPVTEVPLDTTCPSSDSEEDACNSGTFLNCKGEEWELVQIVNTQRRVYTEFYPLKITSTARSVECGCPNLYVESSNTGHIRDGWLYVNFNKGNIYVNYQGGLEDEQGNLMVLDHPLINEFYEYAMKERILENRVLDGKTVTQAQIQLINQKLRMARNAALSLVRMPNYEELKKTFESNRKVMYSKYFDMFAGMSWLSGNRSSTLDYNNRYLRT